MARIVFDLDGTLIDSAPDLQAIANAVLAAEGLAPITMAETRDFIGNGAGVFVQKFRAVRGVSDSHHARLLADFMARYDTAHHLTRPYPGVLAALHHLQDAGHALGICTNKPLRPTRAVLDHLGLGAFFSTIWGGDSLAVHKPDPAPLHAAFTALYGGPCLYVGDSDVDAETAQRASVAFALFTEGYRKSPVEALHHTASFAHFDDLPRVVDAILAQGAAPGTGS